MAHTDPKMEAYNLLIEFDFRLKMFSPKANMIFFSNFITSSLNFPRINVSNNRTPLWTAPNPTPRRTTFKISRTTGST